MLRSTPKNFSNVFYTQSSKMEFCLFSHFQYKCIRLKLPATHHNQYYNFYFYKRTQETSIKIIHFSDIHVKSFDVSRVDFFLYFKKYIINSTVNYNFYGLWKTDQKEWGEIRLLILQMVLMSWK